MREDNIYDLFYASISETASTQQRAKLIEILENDPKVHQEYVEFVMLFTQLYRREGAIVDFGIEQDSGQVDNVLKDLCLQEQKAISVEIETEMSPESAPEVIELPQKHRTSVFFKVYNVIVSAAALFMFLFIAYSELFPANLSEPVATVIDQLGVEWAANSESLSNTDRVYTYRSPFKLDRGSLKLTYDDGVDVVIEGPAKFTIEKKGIDLRYGRLYSYVSKSGRGFTVKTANSRFVDLGTEFGVEADVRGFAELHVLKGEVQLLAGSNKNSQISKIVTANNAIVYSAKDNVISDIPVKSNTFIREVSSEKIMQWRGRAIDLADIVGGGNGLGSGKANYGISFKDGSIGFVESETPAFRVRNYVKAQHPFIDGVFIPDGGTGSVKVTSTDITYDQFPDTKAECYAPVCNNTVIKQGFDDTAKFGSLLLEGVTVKDQAQICLHSNAGITFDLEAISSSHSDAVIRCFTTKFGLIDIGEEEPTDVDLFILVDGHERFSHLGYLSSDKLLDIELEINKGDRFLTIVCTEGSRNFSDWPILIGPILKLDSQ